MQYVDCQHDHPSERRFDILTFKNCVLEFQACYSSGSKQTSPLSLTKVSSKYSQQCTSVSVIYVAKYQRRYRTGTHCAPRIVVTSFEQDCHRISFNLVNRIENGGMLRLLAKYVQSDNTFLIQSLFAICDMGKKCMDHQVRYLSDDVAYFIQPFEFNVILHLLSFFLLQFAQ